MKNKYIEEVFRNMKAEALRTHAVQATCVIPLSFECESCGENSVHYALYWDELGRMDLFFCRVCHTYSEVNGKTGERVDTVFTKVLGDFNERNFLHGCTGWGEGVRPQADGGPAQPVQRAKRT
jgi:hypothetical protein